MNFWVYTLVNEQGQPRYIGKTNNPTERLRNHLKEKGRCHRICWLKSMKQQGVKPKMVLLDSKKTEQEALDEEIFLIAYFRYLGADLTNETVGGEGISGHKHTLETRRKMSNSHKGHLTSAETRDKISKAQLGKPRHSGWHHSQTTKSKITGRPPRKLEDDFGNQFANVNEAATMFGVSVDQIKYALQKGIPAKKVPRLHYVGSPKVPAHPFSQRS